MNRDELTPLNGYTQDERAYLRDTYRAWVREHGKDALRDSLNDLIHTHGYSPPEVAEWLGLSRQGLHLVMQDLGVEPANMPSRYRTWDGEQFAPDFDDPLSVAKLRERGMRQRATWDRKRTAKMERGAEVIRAMADELGRPPYAREVMDHLGYEAHQMTHFATRHGMQNGGRVAAFLDELWREAGFDRPDGRKAR